MMVKRRVADFHVGRMGWAGWADRIFECGLRRDRYAQSAFWFVAWNAWQAWFKEEKARGKTKKMVLTPLLTSAG